MGSASSDQTARVGRLIFSGSIFPQNTFSNDAAQL